MPDVYSYRYVGDVGPLKLQCSDRTGVLTTLTGASQIELQAIGRNTAGFSGDAEVIDPPEVDPDGVHEWNVLYQLTSDDTQAPDTFDLYVTVTWPDESVDTFAHALLVVKPKT